jgi:LacI family transcriptional regulator
MVTLKDIAMELDVSLSLVSKVLNNRMGTTNVRPAKLKLIKAKAKEMGYAKNSSAVSLLTGKQNSIGIFLHCSGAVGSGIMEKLLMGMSNSLHEHNKRQSLCFYGNKEEFAELVKTANRGIMDGLLIGNIKHSVLVEILLDLQNAKMPIVTMYDEPIHPGIINVGIDQIKVGELATNHLLEQGCKNIVHIKNMDERLEGYKNALNKAGIPFDDKRVFSVNEPGTRDEYGSHIGEKAVKYFIDNEISFDGIVAQSDGEAMGCMNSLAKMGVNVPKDVKVIGVDNSPYCDFTAKTLSSIDQNKGTQGSLAADILLQKIDKNDVASIMIEPSLVVRESTAS